MAEKQTVENVQKIKAMYTALVQRYDEESDQI
jgi:hypothetical protein